MPERRNEQRRRTLKTGRIVFNNRFSAIDCAVRNLSEHGAMLLVAGPHGIPDEFLLELDEGGITHQCRVMWRNAKQIGVEFL
jgi:hypothetical protein